jgi:hypothetical protein
MRIAVIKEISSGKERQVHQGYTINGIQLELVEPDRVVFTQFEDREELKLKIQRSAKNNAAVPAQKPVRQPAVAPTSGQFAQPVVRPRVEPSSSARIEMPAPIVAPAQTVEDRAKNPLLKDFYK